MEDKDGPMDLARRVKLIVLQQLFQLLSRRCLDKHRNERPTRFMNDSRERARVSYHVEMLRH